jgi:hypothetical protein
VNLPIPKGRKEVQSRSMRKTNSSFQFLTIWMALYVALSVLFGVEHRDAASRLPWWNMGCAIGAFIIVEGARFLSRRWFRG